MESTYRQVSLWEDILPGQYNAKSCYLCGDKAEGKCMHCGRRVCWVCGVGWALIRNPYSGEYECQFGDVCENALYHRFDRHCNLMRGLVASDYDYPRVNLESFLHDHERLWAWAVAHQEKYRLCRVWDPGFRRDFRTALNRCRKFLGLPATLTRKVS